MPDRLTFTKNGVDITEGIELRNGRALPGGWSQHEVWLKEPAGEGEIEYQIAILECGAPSCLAEGFSFRIDHDAARI
jgi:hypothetical protein